MLLPGFDARLCTARSLTDAPAAGETMLLSVAVNGSLPGNALDAARLARVSANAGSFSAGDWNDGGRLLYMEVIGAAP